MQEENPPQPIIYGAADLQKLAARLAQKNADETLVVIALCAEWCAVCRDFLPLYQKWTQEYNRSQNPRGDIYFVALDIDDPNAPAAALNVDDFPTFAVFRDRKLVFLSQLLARTDTLENHLPAWQKASTPLPIPPEMNTLYAAIYR